jgi:hypothetical protein
MDYFLIYLATRADSLQGALMALTVFLGILTAFGVTIFVAASSRGVGAECWGWIGKPMKVGLISFLFLIFASVMTPSTKDIAVIYVLPKILHNQELQKIPNNLLKLANNQLEVWIKEKSEEVKNN